jgi:uncharacterized membrane protein YeaQ/YmgE (transglycosylase-associated protein family)
MNIVMWILAGGAVGWAAFTLLGINEERGTLVSIIIGAFGGVVGGQVVAPMMASAPIVAGNFNFQALFIAAVGASACLAIGNMIERRFGV